jgi:hypothetical protein
VARHFGNGRPQGSAKSIPKPSRHRTCRRHAQPARTSAAARFRAAIRPWARLRLAHALLKESVNRFREGAQAPMVAEASTYFSLILLC